MKISQRKLKRIIKEEISSALKEQGGTRRGIMTKNVRMEGNTIVVTVEKDGKEAEGRHEVKSARRMNLARTAAYEKAVQNWVRKYG